MVVCGPRSLLTDVNTSEGAAGRLAVAERAAGAGAMLALRGFRTSLRVETKASRTDHVTQADLDAQRRVVEVIRTVHPGEPVVGEEATEAVEEAIPSSGPAWVVDPIDGTGNYVRGVPWWTTSVAALVDGEPVAAATVMPTVGDRYVAGASAPGEGENDADRGDDADGVSMEPNANANANADGNADADADATSHGSAPPHGTESGPTVTSPAAVARLNDEPMRVSEVEEPALATVSPIMWHALDDREGFVELTAALLERFDDVRRFGSAQATLALVAAGGIDGVVTRVTADPWDTVAGVHLIRRAGGTVTDVAGEPWRPDAPGLVASNGHLHGALLEVLDAGAP